MKLVNLKNLTALLAVTALSACGDNELGKPVDDTKIPAVTVDNPVLTLEVGETSGKNRISLLQGVENSYTQNDVYVVKFKHEFEVDEEGIKLDSEPVLPSGAITKQAEDVIIDASAWLDILEFEESVEYEFSYKLDNGSSEQIERVLIVRVLGEEVKAEQIDIHANDNAEVPVGSTIQLTTVVSPANTTFPELTWVSSDSSKATVDDQGMITGVAQGSVTISATSKDGDVTATRDLMIVTDSDKPIGVEISKDNQQIDMLTVEQGQAIQLTADVLFQNKTAQSDDSVSWTSYNPEFFSVNASGLVQGLKVLNSGTLDVRTNDQGYSDKVSVKVTPSKNLLFNHNYSFESGELSPWIKYWENIEGSTYAPVKLQHTAGNMVYI
ncbi:Ig-like domain-containing protein [Catenovulum sediminis]|uniref:Ig-like domain-containing protein n=1 Tax=Catenovulum sediminis TaxID=1740262 RepID=UPI00117C24B0|nr:Ig-like domain-containing protein [Catenovulum sediminis]